MVGEAHAKRPVVVAGRFQDSCVEVEDENNISVIAFGRLNVDTVDLLQR